MDQNVHKLLTTKIRRGQSIMEYTIIIAIVVGALVIMQVYMKRGIQAAVKVAADQLGNQDDSERIDLEKGGYLLDADVSTREAGMRNTTVIPPWLSEGEPINRATNFERTTNTQSSEIYIQGEYEEE